jgi:flagellin FlaB
MKAWFCKSAGSFHRGERGITGLETAIILIAFVTVAAVLAYSVLSAGIFSSERGKEAVYQGLETAQATMKVTSSVYVTGSGLGPTYTTVQNVSFQLSSVLQDQDVDMAKCVVNFMSYNNVALNLSNVLGAGNVSGFTGLLKPNEVKLIEINVASFNLTAYDFFVLEVIPPTGATIQIRRNLPGEIEAVMNLY